MTDTAFQLLAGWFAIDLMTGCYHLLIDSLADGGWLLRTQVREFQIHHQKSTLILTHGIFARCWQTTTAGLLALVFACFGWPVFWVTVFVGAALCQQAHYWAHHPSPPRVVGWLQESGVLLRREGHARHHDGTFLRNYCILCGWADGVLNLVIDAVRARRCTT